jgi:hypothetical protein
MQNQVVTSASPEWTRRLERMSSWLAPLKSGSPRRVHSDFSINRLDSAPDKNSPFGRSQTSQFGVYASQPDGGEEPLHIPTLAPMSAAEIEASAARDRDNPLLIDAPAGKLRRIPRVETLRRALALTQEEFAARYKIPLGAQLILPDPVVPILGTW